MELAVLTCGAGVLAIPTGQRSYKNVLCYRPHISVTEQSKTESEGLKEVEDVHGLRNWDLRNLCLLRYLGGSVG